MELQHVQVFKRRSDWIRRQADQILFHDRIGHAIAPAICLHAAQEKSHIFDHLVKDELQSVHSLAQATHLKAVRLREIVGVEVDSDSLRHYVRHHLEQLAFLVLVEDVLIGLEVDADQVLFHFEEIDLVLPDVQDYAESVQILVGVVIEDEVA